MHRLQAAKLQFHTNQHSFLSYLNLTLSSTTSGLWRNSIACPSTLALLPSRQFLLPTAIC